MERCPEGQMNWHNPVEKFRIGLYFLKNGIPRISWWLEVSVTKANVVKLKLDHHH